MEDKIVWVQAALVSNMPVGLELYSIIESTIKEHPERFPFETKYIALDKSVHEAYAKEYNEVFEIVPFDIALDRAMESNGNEQGFMGFIDGNIAPVTIEPLTAKSLTDFFEKLSSLENSKIVRRRKEIEVWNKHYKKYGIPHGSLFSQFQNY
jgi:hypothetical protein